MKARMEVTLDTTWTNQVVCIVECELDNPHTVTSQMLAEMMVVRLGYMAAEIRHANERGAAELQAPIDHERSALAGEPERERQAYEEIRRQREDQSIFDAEAQREAKP